MPASGGAAFISYSRSDSEFALRLAEDLKAAGTAVWLDQIDIGPGMEWDDAIEAALNGAAKVLLILSPTSVSSRNVRNEVAFALDAGKAVIPIVHLECVVPLQLKRIQHIDFRANYAQGLDALLRSLAPEAAHRLSGTGWADNVVPANPDASTGAGLWNEAERGDQAPVRSMKWFSDSRTVLSAVSIVLLVLGLTVVASRFLHPSVPASLKDFALLIPVVIAFTNSKGPRRSPEEPFRLNRSFTRGLYGGLIGGSISGLLIGLPYFFENGALATRHTAERVTWSIVPESVLYSALIGLAVGAATQYTIGWFRHLSQHHVAPLILCNDVSGGILGGILAGACVGAEGGWLFGSRAIPPVSDAILVCGAAAGPIFIVLGTLTYDYDGRWQAMARAVLCSSVVAYLATSAGIFLLQRYGIGGAWFLRVDAQTAIREGAVLGVAVGSMLGLQVGLSVLFYRLFQVHAERV